MFTPTPVLEDPRPITVDEALEQIDKMIENAITPRCEVIEEDGAPACGLAAMWLVSLSCGHSAFQCDPHAEELRASIAELDDDVTIVCDHPKTNAPWHPRPMTVTVSFDRIAS